MFERFKRAIGIGSEVHAASYPRVEPEIHLDRPTETASYEAGADPSKGAAADLECMPVMPSSVDADQARSRDILAARHDHITRNQGQAAGALRDIIANSIGTGLKLNMNVDYAAMGADREWAKGFNAEVERRFKAWTESPRHHVDASGRASWLGLQKAFETSVIKHGEAFASFETKRVAGSEFISRVRLINPTRISDPKDHPTEMRERDIRSGIEYNGDGAPVAVWISSRHPRDQVGRGLKARERLKWKRYPIRGRNGRQVIFHAVNVEDVEQSRGVGLVSAAIRAIAMCDKLSDVTLQSAILQTVFSAVVKSNADWTQIMEVIGANAGEELTASQAMAKFQQMRGNYYEKNRPKIGTAETKVIHLLPDEELELKRAANADPKIADLLRQLELEGARAFGLSAEEYSGDYSKTSFSASRMATQRSHRVIAQRRAVTTEQFCKWVLGVFMEELLIRNHDMLPKDVSFYDHRDALTTCTFQGPPPIDADPSKSAKASTERLNNRTSSLTRECALLGYDFEDIARERAAERDLLQELGLTEQDIMASMTLKSGEEVDPDEDNEPNSTGEQEDDQ